MSGRRIRDFVKGLTSSGGNEEAVEADEDDTVAVSASDGSKVDAIDPKSDKPLKRVLYTANVGDARAVLRYVPPISLLCSELPC
jgi:protein phosphatase PTC1